MRCIVHNYVHTVKRVRQIRRNPNFAKISLLQHGRIFGIIVAFQGKHPAERDL